MTVCTYRLMWCTVVYVSLLPGRMFVSEMAHNYAATCCFSAIHLVHLSFVHPSTFFFFFNCLSLFVFHIALLSVFFFLSQVFRFPQKCFSAVNSVPFFFCLYKFISCTLENLICSLHIHSFLSVNLWVFSFKNLFFVWMALLFSS